MDQPPADVPPPSPLGMDIRVGERVYTVLRLGAPVCSKSAAAAYLGSLAFTAAHLTLVAESPVDPAAPQLAYVAWCSQAPAQKVVTPDLYKALCASADEASPGWRDDTVETVTLPDGRSFAVPRTASAWSPVTPKKRKLADVKRACGVIAQGAFVLDDELLAGGKVHQEVKRVTFDPDAARLKHLTAFAEMLTCMTVAPTVENLHSWASAALRARS